MRTAVLQRAGMENVPSGAAFVSAAEVNGYINYGLQRLYNLLVQARGQEYYRSTYAITTSASTSSYSLPANFMQLISVDVSVGGPITISARKYSESERNLYKWMPSWTMSTPVCYQLQGANINFLPVPPGAYTITLNYVPTYTPLVADGDVFDGVAGFEEYAIWDAVACCLAKEESDTGWALQKRAELERMIEELGAQRHAGAAERVRDVTLEGNDSFGWGLF